MSKVDKQDLEILKTIVDAAEDKKAENVSVLDVRGISPIAEYFVFTSANNIRHNLTISDSIEDTLRGRKIKPLHAEGKNTATWILLDYGNIIVHLFLEEQRQFYDLESLWGDARRMNLN